MPDKDWQLKQRIEAVLEIHKDYGYRRIAGNLQMNEKPIQRVMRKFGIKAYRRYGKKWRKKATSLPNTYPNLLREMVPSYPGHVWVADFTELSFHGQVIYLATVMDVFTREIVGWAISTRRNLVLVEQALFSALLHHPRPTIFHSDNGSEYDAHVFVEALQTVGTQISRIHPGCPWENGYQESFYGRLKISLGDPNCCKTLGELVYAIYQELHRYNRSRIHSALLMSPLQFKRQFAQQKSLRVSV